MRESKISLKDKVARFPDLPGVYLMKDRLGNILYIGKAKRLRARVLSYFRGVGDGRPRIPHLLAKVEDIEYVVTGNEKEALLLESNLIKKHRPKYNVYWKDDKTYYHLRIDFSQKYPCPALVRRPRADQAKYFGPYSSSRSLKSSLAFLRKIFPFRSCRNGIFRHRTRPCLFYQTGRCPAPCQGFITPREYKSNLQQLVRALEGKNEHLIRYLKNQINTASEKLEYEKAACLRDRLAAFELMTEKQIVSRVRPSDLDVFSYSLGAQGTAFYVLRLVKGEIDDSVSARMDHQLPEPMENLEIFLFQFYQAREIPPLILLPEELPGAQSVLGFLRERRGSQVKFQYPRRGPKKKLMELATRNARHSLLSHSGRALRARELEELQNKLGLKNYPSRLECFDISNLGDEFPVASMVVFVDGERERRQYRIFHIHRNEGANDYEMMAEVLRRRFRAGSTMPDLIVLDGGKGQLNIGRKILVELGITEPDLIALAKEKLRGGKKVYDRVYLPGRKNPVGLRTGGGGLRLLAQARNEAHRFAIRHHRLLRSKAAIDSPFRKIKGVGPVLDRRLRAKYGGTSALRGVSLEELIKIPGLTPAVARNIISFLEGGSPANGLIFLNKAGKK